MAATSAAVLVIGGTSITSPPGMVGRPTSGPSGHRLPIGGAAVIHGGLELELYGLVSPHLEELAVAHNVDAHGRSGHHSGRGRLKHHHADLAEEVVGAQATSVGATHEHVHLALREQVEGMVAHSLGDERGACRDRNFVHLGGEELQVDAGEAREERNLLEVVDSGCHRSLLHMECIVPCAALLVRGGGGVAAPGSNPVGATTVVDTRVDVRDQGRRPGLRDTGPPVLRRRRELSQREPWYGLGTDGTTASNYLENLNPGMHSVESTSSN